jgi:protein-disulfide isomerase
MDSNKQNLAVPIAIVIAGIIIASAFYFSNSSGSNNVAKQDLEDNQQAQQAEQPTGSTDDVNPVTEDDHIKGNINAAVKIVEYSDFECPFCQRFHGTMNQIVDEYDGDQVAWVYRQFPLEQLHPVKAMAEAVASECAAELGGNDAFWQFADRMFELTETNNRTDIETVIPQIVNEIGLDNDAFQECFASGRYDDDIQEDIENAVVTGGRGTPWSVVIGPDGTTYPLNGAQPYASVKQLIDLVLSNK